VQPSGPRHVRRPQQDELDAAQHERGFALVKDRRYAVAMTEGGLGKFPKAPAGRKQSVRATLGVKHL
jgi:hypothetical protein